MDTERIKELEATIADLERRMPKHSVPPAMARELEDLEDELEEALAAEAGAAEAGAADGGATRGG